MHELDTKGGAIGPTQNFQHFRNGGKFQAQHVVDEDLAIIIGLGETIRGWMQLFVILGFRQFQRIEICMKMATHAIGTDHHQGTNGIACRLLNCLIAQLNALARSLGLELVAQFLLVGTPITVKSRNQFAGLRNRPIGPFPGCTACPCNHIFFFVLEILKESLPLRSN